MIVPDVNLLVYAYNEDAPRHRDARAWWETTLNSGLPVGVPWAASCGFLRIMSDARILPRPLTPLDAWSRVQSWLEIPSVRVLDPGPRHVEMVRRLLEVAGVGGRLTTDIHLAAIALEFHAELHSNDRDYGRFRDLRWVNPLERR